MSFIYYQMKPHFYFAHFHIHSSWSACVVLHPSSGSVYCRVSYFISAPKHDITEPEMQSSTPCRCEHKQQSCHMM